MQFLGTASRLIVLNASLSETMVARSPLIISIRNVRLITERINILQCIYIYTVFVCVRYVGDGCF